MADSVTNPAAPDDRDTTVRVLKQIQPTVSPILQKLIAFLIGILTGVGGDFSEKGNYSKSQTATVLGTTYTFTETVDGSADIKATPS